MNAIDYWLAASLAIMDDSASQSGSSNSGIPNGTAVTLLRDEYCATPADRRSWGSVKILYR